MLGGIDGGAHRGDIAGDPGGGLVVAGQNGLDAVVGVGLEDALVLGGRYLLAPCAFDGVDIQALVAAQLDPAL
jgi:hypothetical protein